MEKIFIIVNPVSSNKVTAKEWPQFEKVLLGSGYEFEAALTERPGHATELTRQALNAGYKTIMSVGGDGTMNEVVNGFFEGGKLMYEDSRLVVFSRGTGCDFIKTLGIKKGIEELLLTLERNEARKIDVGRVDFIDTVGKTVTRYFMNVADIGLGAETANRVNKHSKLLKGFLSFMLGAVSTIILYKNKNFEVVIDDKTVLKARMNSVIIANGKYFGGGMKVAPEALVDDGVFDIITLGDLSKLELIKSFPLIYEGKHLSHPKVKMYRGSKVKVRSNGEGLIEVDGEIPGSDDAEFELLPKVLNILV
ncbi:MAG TPA: diacylglycerol kinase family protein [Clostridia bacterium]|nr:diacylglycerol kinase family protein [Clostridia bacterium]